MSVPTSLTGGMATEAQITKIREFVASDGFNIPLASFLKDITGGRASCIDELTQVQAKDVLGVFGKLIKQKK